ncbi:hypothetical protein GCM10010124_36830 [Pilimelia terevasa]|uniref:DUF6545 domain-containing protein n=1 Tax=Pilimelia terevasa TaxID=53372 RepID=A0A8J3BQ02_9ACTN|nr:MAB_1171c family putative transporter [Pilimelia terevasa]GGK40647.1 hypothetical protein GCM10010124_36830 [Pilimelia terevasa]
MGEVAVDVAAAVLVTAAGCYKAVHLARNPGNPTLRALVLGAGLLALGMWLGVAWLYAAFDELVGVANAARLARHLCALGVAAASQSLFLWLADPSSAARRARRRVACCVGAGIGMAVLFTQARVPVEAPRDFAARYADQPQIAAYMLLYLAVLGFAAVDQFCAAVRFARRCSGLVQVSGYLFAGAFAAGGCYVAATASVVVAGVRGARAASYDTAPLLLLIMVLLVGAVVLPSVWPRLATAARAPLRRRLYRRIGPLWRALHAAAPHMTMRPASQAATDHAALGHIRDALYWRVIECHDALRALRPLLAVATPQGGADGVKALAASIYRALSNDHTTAPPAVLTSSAQDVDGGVACLDADARHLADVSDVYTALRLAAELTDCGADLQSRREPGND